MGARFEQGSYPVQMACTSRPFRVLLGAIGPHLELAILWSRVQRGFFLLCNLGGGSSCSCLGS